MTESSIWLPKGEQGDPGPQGPIGPEGPQGPVGPPGPGAEEFAQFKADLANNSDPAKGAALIGYRGQTLFSRLDQFAVSTNWSTLKEAADLNLNIVVPAGTHPVTDMIEGRNNQSILFMPGAIIPQSQTGNAGVFSIDAGVSGFSLRGPGQLRGPAYGGTPVPNPVYPASNGAIRLTGLATSRVVSPVIEGIIIDGWNDYGIFAENVLDGKFNNNTIKNCGRDGIRFYGALFCQANINRIDNISPGFGGVAPNLNVYGITYTRRATAGSNPTIDPASRHSQAIGNLITNTQTWKALDTHGGQDLLFADNTLMNTHIGIGIDEGDTPSATDSPPLRIKCIGNNITRGNGLAGGAGINMSSSSSANMGQNNSLIGNTINGFGGPGTGGINFAYQAGALISDNVILNSDTAGINIPSGVRCTGFRLSNNTIQTLLGTPLAAIAIQAVEAQGVVDGVTFIRTSGTFIGFSLVEPTAGYGLQVGGEINQFGTMTLYAPSAKGRIVGGSAITDTFAYCRVTGAGVLSDAYGVASVSKVGTGVYDVTLSNVGIATSTMHPDATLRSTSAGQISALPTSTSVIRVSTFNAAGAAADSEFSLTVTGK